MEGAVWVSFGFAALGARAGCIHASHLLLPELSFVSFNFLFFRRPCCVFHLTTNYRPYKNAVNQRSLHPTLSLHRYQGCDGSLSHPPHRLPRVTVIHYGNCHLCWILPSAPSVSAMHLSLSQVRGVNHRPNSGREVHHQPSSEREVHPLRKLLPSRVPHLL
jgi:hypothetical protein